MLTEQRSDCVGSLVGYPLICFMFGSRVGYLGQQIEWH